MNGSGTVNVHEGFDVVNDDVIDHVRTYWFCNGANVVYYKSTHPALISLVILTY